MVSRIGAASFFVGCVAMAGSVLFGLTVTPGAAAEAARSGVVTSAYERNSRRANRLYEAHMVLSYSTWALIGTAILMGSLLPQWLGWTGIVAGVGATAAFVTMRAPVAPPILTHLFGLVVGVVLLVS
jgi:hypothetical protein